ncbi:hypothetical protein MRX96_037674 [Rhipicephalus microplus]
MTQVRRLAHGSVLSMMCGAHPSFTSIVSFVLLAPFIATLSRQETRIHRWGFFCVTFRVRVSRRDNGECSINGEEVSEVVAVGWVGGNSTTREHSERGGNECKGRTREDMDDAYYEKSKDGKEASSPREEGVKARSASAILFFVRATRIVKRPVVVCRRRPLSRRASLRRARVEVPLRARQWADVVSAMSRRCHVPTHNDVNSPGANGEKCRCGGYRR